jgi:hypothetical protein
MLGLNDKILKLMDGGLQASLVALERSPIQRFINRTYNLLVLGGCDMVRYIISVYI